MINIARYWFVGFLAILTVPLLILIITPFLTTSEQERSAPTTQPKPPNDLSQWKAFPEHVDKYLSESLPGRAVVVSMVSQARYAAGATTGDVLVGKEGWLFYTGNRVLEKMSGELVEIGRLEIMANFLEKIHTESSRRGVRFLFAVAPNKHTIYREKMSSEMHPVPMEQERTILADLMQTRGTPSVNLTAILMAAKDTNQVYWKTDTHWNELGASIAFNAIVDNFGYGYAAVEIGESLVTRKSADFSGDLARMLGLYGLLTEPRLEYRPAEAVADLVSEVIRPAKGFVYEQRRDLDGYELEFDRAGPTILVIGDSFANYKPHFSRFAKKAIFIHSLGCRVDVNQLYDHKPDLILYQVIERSLGCDIR